LSIETISGEIRFLKMPVKKEGFYYKIPVFGCGSTSTGFINAG
jgi:hypothetical protein